jgi:hypothetical protein
MLMVFKKKKTCFAIDIIHFSIITSLCRSVISLCRYAHRMSFVDRHPIARLPSAAMTAMGPTRIVLILVMVAMMNMVMRVEAATVTGPFAYTCTGTPDQVCPSKCNGCLSGTSSCTYQTPCPVDYGGCNQTTDVLNRRDE